MRSSARASHAARATLAVPDSHPHPSGPAGPPPWPAGKCAKFGHLKVAGAARPCRPEGHHLGIRAGSRYVVIAVVPVSAARCCPPRPRAPFCLSTRRLYGYRAERRWPGSILDARITPSPPEFHRPTHPRLARLAGHRSLTALAAGAAKATEATEAATTARHADEGGHQARHPNRLHVRLGQVSVQLRE